MFENYLQYNDKKTSSHSLSERKQVCGIHSICAQCVLWTRKISDKNRQKSLSHLREHFKYAFFILSFFLNLSWINLIQIVEGFFVFVFVLFFILKY